MYSLVNLVLLCSHKLLNTKDIVAGSGELVPHTQTRLKGDNCYWYDINPKLTDTKKLEKYVNLQTRYLPYSSGPDNDAMMNQNIAAIPAEEISPTPIREIFFILVPNQFIDYSNYT